MCMMIVIEKIYQYDVHEKLLSRKMMLSENRCSNRKKKEKKNNQPNLKYI